MDKISLVNRGVVLLVALGLSATASVAVELELKNSDNSQPRGERVEPSGYQELGEPTTVDQAQSGRLLFKTEHPGWYLPAPQLETEVEISVRGMIARTRVRQRFRNPTDYWVEGVYVFPLPEMAAVDRLEMVIGDRVIEGQIREREQAKKEYQKAKTEGRRASLVEQERPNMFTNSVANIGPGESIEVVIGYQQELDYDNGSFGLRFPMVVGPKYIPGLSSVTGISGQEGSIDAFAGTGWAANTDQVPDASRVTPPVLPPANEDSVNNPVRVVVDLDVGFLLERLVSPSHSLEVENQGTRYQLELADGQVPADRDFVLEWAPRFGEAPQAALFVETLESDEGSHYVYLMVVPPQQDGSTRLPREVIFVLDTSGSMSGDSIRQAKAALFLALDRLGPADRFNLIEFNNSVRALFAHSQPAVGGNVAAAKQRVQRLVADGGTEMLSALQAALADLEEGTQVRQVVFITDGAVGNEDALFGEIHRHLGRSRLFTVGIGSAPNSHFMRRAAQFGRGTFTHVGTPEEVASKMGGLLRKLESPVLSDIELDWGDQRAEVWPQRVPDLYSGQPLVVVAELERLGGEVRIRGTRTGQPWMTSLALVGGGRQDGIGKAWARRKIGATMDRQVVDGSTEALRAAVVELGLQHHLVTRFTSLVAVDLTPVRPRSEPMLTKPLPVHLPSGWNHDRVFGSLPRTATSSRALLWTGVLCLILAALSHGHVQLREALSRTHRK